ncbi:gluconokinase [Flavivirga eckloniae]|uniref:gluconokinase n=1 Tax=Flavivirga eckloniae TaxID=1803846 RepID=UPI0018F85FF9|nr:gluconokinase [Flavivirga eckloniae]
MPQIIIIMGVSGCGKTTVGKKLSEELSIPFFDGDDFHPKENIDKMNNNIGLTDADRLPWLEILSSKIEDWSTSTGAILACSALKESYRDILKNKNENIIWVLLNGEFDLVLNRIENRKNHFMKPDLLQSQFDTLEIPSYGLHINIDKGVKDIVKEITNKINEHA